jgi:hypothetical protein
MVGLPHNIMGVTFSDLLTVPLRAPLFLHVCLSRVVVFSLYSVPPDPPQLITMQALGQHPVVSRPPAARVAGRRLAVRVYATATLNKPSGAARPLPHGRIFNFSAGPAILPQEVRDLQRVVREHRC